ncbi:hypothetical protein [Mucilaginibacter koreensis]
MKNSTKTQVLLKALDIELKSLLSNDLKNYKAAKQGNTKQAA